MNLFVAPFVNALFGFYYLFGNLAISIILVTLLIRFLLLPLLLPSLKSSRKMQDLQPQLKKLNDQYGKDKTALATAQMALYKREGINPLSGCLPNILQLAVLMIFFSAFNMVSGFAEGKIERDKINQQLIPSFQVKEDFKINDEFFGIRLSETPIKIFRNGVSIDWLLPLILLLGSAGLQYFTAKLMLPTSAPKDTAYTKETPGKEDDMMAVMRTQSLYMMPMMTLFIGLNFSLGVLLYWFVNSSFILGQQKIVLKSPNGQ